MRKVKKTIKKGISIFLLLLSGILVAACYYISKNFPNVSFEQLIYSLLYSEGTSMSAISEGLFVGSIVILIFLIIILFPFYIKLKTKTVFYLTIRKKEIKIPILPLPINCVFGYSLLVFFVCFGFTMYRLGGIHYFMNQMDRSSIFEDYYVNPKEVNVTFAQKKKNLIYIFVESLEMSTASSANGGGEDVSYIPHLEQISLDAINFSNGQKLGGAKQVDGVGWTVGGMVAQTAGIPLKIKIYGNAYSGYSHFLPGVYSLGEILSDNGYRNYLMMGSDASFGGRNEYFTQHGNYELFDYNWAIENSLISQDYHEWWGYEDLKLFEYAKSKLLEIANSSEPFNFTLLTADTHFPSGYIDKSCEQNLPFEQHYANSFYCSDNMIYQFIEWLKQQDFYDDTVVVISGDHLTMQEGFYSNLATNYERVVYNAFLNTDLSDKYTKNRLFTTMDMYPTTLAALGADISGNQLGLGTNLFSGKKTIMEKLGDQKMNNALKKNSRYYNKYLLGDSYMEMYKNIEKEKGESEE